MAKMTISGRIVYVVNGWDYNGIDAIYLNLEGEPIYHDVTFRFKHGSFVDDAQTLLAGTLTAPIVDRLPLFWCQCARYIESTGAIDWSQGMIPGLDLEHYVGEWEYMSMDDPCYWRGKETNRG